MSLCSRCPAWAKKLTLASLSRMAFCSWSLRCSILWCSSSFCYWSSHDSLFMSDSLCSESFAKTKSWCTESTCLWISLAFWCIWSFSLDASDILTSNSHLRASNASWRALNSAIWLALSSYITFRSARVCCRFPTDCYRRCTSVLRALFLWHNMAHLSLSLHKSSFMDSILWARVALSSSPWHRRGSCIVIEYEVFLEFLL